MLDIYWRQIDPTQADGQFTDIGPSYRAAIFYSDDEEKKIAEASKEKLARSGKFDKPIVTEILPAMKFYPAEAYHQKYYQQNPEHFEAFEKGRGESLSKRKPGSDRRHQRQLVATKLDNLHAFAGGALGVEIAQAFCHRADFAIADQAVVIL